MAITQWRKIGNEKALKHLSTVSSPTASSFYTIFNSILQKHPFSESEASKLLEIENVRHDLQQNRDVIEMVDYGAGSPDLLSPSHQRTLRLPVAYIYRSASSHRKWGELLFRLVRAFEPAYCLEFGTSLGISGLYQLAALSLNEKGKLTTMEGSPQIAHIAQRNFEQLHYTNVASYIGPFDEVLPDILKSNPHIDMAFIDGHHEEKATLHYFNTLLPYVSENAILIFDDINWSDGMRKAWEEIKKNKTVHLSFDLYKLGICVIQANPPQQDHFQLTL